MAKGSKAKAQESLAFYARKGYEAACAYKVKSGLNLAPSAWDELSDRQREAETVAARAVVQAMLVGVLDKAREEDDGRRLTRCILDFAFGRPIEGYEDESKTFGQ